MLDPEMVQHARGDEVHQVVDGPGAMVEAGGGGHHHGTGAGEAHHVLQVNQ
jgi:hypothetical protein